MDLLTDVETADWLTDVAETGSPTELEDNCTSDEDETVGSEVEPEEDPVKVPLHVQRVVVPGPVVPGAAGSGVSAAVYEGSMPAVQNAMVSPVRC